MSTSLTSEFYLKNLKTWNPLYTLKNFTSFGLTCAAVVHSTLPGVVVARELPPVVSVVAAEK